MKNAYTTPRTAEAWDAMTTREKHADAIVRAAYGTPSERVSLLGVIEALEAQLQTENAK